MPQLNGQALIQRLPEPRGRLTAMAPLAGLTWLRVGGPAEVLFSPADAADLAAFLAAAPRDVPITPIGVGSNLIVRDGGVPGVVIRLGRGFFDIAPDGSEIEVGAGVLDAKLADAAAAAGVAGLEFLRGVPGSIGGAVRMNAGCYGSYVADHLVWAEGVDRSGAPQRMTPPQMGFGYRSSGPQGLIYTRARLRGAPGDPDAIRARMASLIEKRAETQPVKDRTAGSTFKNPAGYSSTGAAGDDMSEKAWALIDRAGCRGLRRGGAMMSEKHSNFLTNVGGATAADLEGLGEEVRARVKAATGYDLEWEVARIGLPLEPDAPGATGPQRSAL